jgi:hypothetical protein
MAIIRSIQVLLLLMIAGCMGNAARSSLDPGQLDVFGVTLSSSADYREIKGVTGVDEPCLRGYERSFDALDIVIGYGNNGKIRKITIRNPQNSMFGIHPGETVEVAKKKIMAAGFATDNSPDRFRKGDLALTLRSDETGKLSGLTLEHID